MLYEHLFQWYKITPKGKEKYRFKLDACSSACYGNSIIIKQLSKWLYGVNHSDSSYIKTPWTFFPFILVWGHQQCFSELTLCSVIRDHPGSAQETT